MYLNKLLNKLCTYNPFIAYLRWLRYAHHKQDTMLLSVAIQLSQIYKSWKSCDIFKANKIFSSPYRARHKDHFISFHRTKTISPREFSYLTDETSCQVFPVRYRSYNVSPKNFIDKALTAPSRLTLCKTWEIWRLCSPFTLGYKCITNRWTWWFSYKENWQLAATNFFFFL